MKTNAGILAKIVGGDANVSGSTANEIYKGIPFDKLQDKIPTVSMCRLELIKILVPYVRYQPVVAQDHSTPKIQGPFKIDGYKEETHDIGPVSAGHNILVCVQRDGNDLTDERLIVRLVRKQCRIVTDELVLVPLDAGCQSDKKVGWGMRGRIEDTGQYSIVMGGELGDSAGFVGWFDSTVGYFMRLGAKKLFGIPIDYGHSFTVQIMLQ